MLHRSVNATGNNLKAPFQKGWNARKKTNGPTLFRLQVGPASMMTFGQFGTEELHCSPLSQRLADGQI